jgi:hypothetical protein
MNHTVKSGNITAIFSTKQAAELFQKRIDYGNRIIQKRLRDRARIEKRTE